MKINVEIDMLDLNYFQQAISLLERSLKVNILDQFLKDLRQQGISV